MKIKNHERVSGNRKKSECKKKHTNFKNIILVISLFVCVFLLKITFEVFKKKVNLYIMTPYNF